MKSFRLSEGQEYVRSRLVNFDLGGQTVRMIDPDTDDETLNALLDCGAIAMDDFRLVAKAQEIRRQRKADQTAAANPDNDVQYVVIDEAGLSAEAQEAIALHREANRQAAEAGRAMNKVLAAGLKIPAGKQVTFANRWGRLTAIISKANGKKADNTPKALDSLFG